MFALVCSVPRYVVWQQRTYGMQLYVSSRTFWLDTENPLAALTWYKGAVVSGAGMACPTPSVYFHSTSRPSIAVFLLDDHTLLLSVTY